MRTTPQPIKRAQVIVINAESAFTKTAYTNDTGRFSLTGLPAGRYTLTVNKPAFLRVSYGAKRYDRPGTPITLKDGAQMNGRHAAHAAWRRPRRRHHGRKRTAGVRRVRACHAGAGAERRAHVRARREPRSMDEITDDHGTYRFFGLPPGEFVVSATPRMFGGEVRAMTEAEIRAVLQALATAATGGRATGDARLLERGNAAAPADTEA